MSLAIFGENSLCSRVKIITIRLKSLLDHTNTTLREDTALQRHISLETYNNLTLTVNITGTVSVNALWHSGLSVINALLTLYLKHLREEIPQVSGTLSRTSEE